MAEGVEGKGLTEWREKLCIVYVHSVSKRGGDKDNTFGIFTLLVLVVGLFYASRFYTYQQDCPSSGNHKVKTEGKEVGEGRMIADTDADVDVTLKDIAKDVAVDAETKESADVPGRQAESQTQIYQIDLEHADKVLSMQDDEVEPTELQEVVEVVTTTKLITEVVIAASATITAAAPQLTTAAALTLTTAPSATRRRKRSAYARELEAKLNKNIDSDEVIDHVQRKEKEDNVVKREDLEVLWQLVKERFTSSKPKNILNDFLLTTLGAMFEKPDIQAQTWKNQRSVHGLAKVKSWKLLESCGVQIITFTTTQLILLVERKYPLTRFTLDQMLNNVRLEVEEKSEVSLELLRFIRQQQ
nr:hypothetical protein [Tanacetum cinerariifolium]